MPMTRQFRGLGAMALACVIWGLSGIFYKLLAHVPPLEVLAHRTLWSMVVFGGVAVMRGQGAQMRKCLSQPRMLAVTAATAVLIACNWLGFIYSIQAGFALQASLGYYIFPLVAVLLGRVIFGDRLRPLQWVAVAMATVAVAQLTVGLGILPRISLMLATTFALYGALKRTLSVDPVASVAAEVVILAPMALIWLAGVHWAGWTGLVGRPGGFFGHDLWTTFLLVLSGPITGMPLLLFAYAAQRISLPTIGLVQYLNPTLQFLVATLAFGEHVTRWHAIAFVLIWSGLALYSLDSLRARARTARPS